MVSEAASLESPAEVGAAPVALEQALAQSHEVKAKVEAAAEELATSNAAVEDKLAAGTTTLSAAETLREGQAVETKVQECADDLHDVTEVLADGVAELRGVELALGDARRALAATAAVLETAQREVAVANLRALHDATTGLPNRTLFDDRLAQALAIAERHGLTVAVMFLDLDRFKVINDTHGHAVGDVVLLAIADRLRQHARDADTVARSGGDEFLYLLVEPQGRDNLARIATQVCAYLAAPITVGALALVVRPSVGVAIFPEHGASGAALVAAADHAMYQAKRLGLGHAFADPA
jgi:diguanylate cyclase